MPPRLAGSGAWHVLGDPARRAAYDQALAREHPPASVSRPPGPAVVTPAARVPGPPPLWAGPVRVDGRHRAPGPAWPDEEEIRLAALAGLALRYLARDWDWPW
jgi:hypothetical protein